MSFWYIAECETCVIKMPFYTYGDRNDWADIHDSIGEAHVTKRYEENN
ncbi:hypothetical protein SEA_FORZA_123 [Gordonia phage Forza]|uniref:Uncharacterized protein n=1 Tax=Gordonia phage Forza TaxID=2571247 RepID=A0A650EY84_9CAUD|nr:hypothetical protein PP303_gp123 [Gordonia phage Forza]QEM41590.1 hypothetical protein SEA_BOOPY_123 [Gordonia phage Boopy]QGT55116.1 hypothetical protein SEA_FORZA_123 [Gordonia phage Forza]UXE04264.1 hypothetical protein SEA_BLUENGOLD_122 [Gordonia phage BlueNGold]WBF03904.1 hypothetical protein SEA_MAREELIH_121 [Gordonia phage Mareelih]